MSDNLYRRPSEMTRSELAGAIRTYDNSLSLADEFRLLLGLQKDPSHIREYRDALRTGEHKPDAETSKHR